jgi:hypothetical protein
MRMTRACGVKPDSTRPFFMSSVGHHSELRFSVNDDGALRLPFRTTRSALSWSEPSSFETKG